MGIWGNREYIDYTELKRRGLLKVKEVEQKMKISKEGFIDFTNNPLNNSESSTSSQTSVSPFGFLDNLSSNSEKTGNADPLSNIVNKADSTELNSMKIKLDDMEYKLDKLIERLEKIESKII